MTSYPESSPVQDRHSFAISAHAICKNYGDFKALNGVSLNVMNGEKVVICGPSGSGKSTFIRCLNALEKHDSGDIVVRGIPLTESQRSVDDVRREVGMVFQQFNLFPHMTVLENCMMAPVRSQGIAKPQARETAMQYLDKVRIASQADKYPSQMSGGQQQRVAIARALCMRPKIMLFDEPTSALDPEMVGEVLQVMEEVAADGMTMVCVTHEMAFARKIADRCVFMDAGKVIEVADGESFFTKPQSPRLQTFLSRSH